ncbi:uro-adherence factor A-like [Littorina saxatilis]|uniref:uro-adherence factor A-like n=1 Tax=Littorina saxatilis TaxID=31220 RepID=UPI0038B671EB
MSRHECRIKPKTHRYYRVLQIPSHYSNSSGQSEVEIIESNGSRRLGSDRRHSRDQFSSLDEIAEESCETINSGSSRRLGNELHHGGDELSSPHKIEEEEDLHGEDNADESSKEVLEGSGSLDESDALRDSRDYGDPQAVGPETSTSEDSSLSSLDKTEEQEDLNAEDNAEESSKGVLEGAGSLDESDALRDSRDYRDPQAVGPETSTSEDSSVCPSNRTDRLTSVRTTEEKDAKAGNVPKQGQ